MGSSRNFRTLPQPLSGGIHAPRLHLALYSFLLVATPFIMLRSFMQDAIGRLSASTLSLGHLEVPLVPAGAVAILLILSLALRGHITRRVLLAGLAGLCMFALGQRVSDHYFGHRFYELQQNWHYIAYSIFAFMAHRDLKPRGVPAWQRILITFILAACYSTFDETVQLFLNNRVFDMSDIGKDAWGVLTGMTMLLIGSEQAELRPSSWKGLRQTSLKGYLTHTPSLWTLLIVLAFSFLSYASLLTELQYTGVILAFTAGTFVLFFAILHCSQFRRCGRILAGTAAIGIFLLGYGFARDRDSDEVGHGYGWVIYRGIPLPFFDVLIFPDRTFRLIDKKHYFNNRDRNFIDQKEADIVIIGTGDRSLGGKGFPHSKGSRFLYNRFTRRGSQVILLSTPEACSYFTRLKKAGKRVLFIIHSTC